MSAPLSGPIFERVDTLLAATPAYRDWRGGRLGAEGYRHLLDAERARLVAGGVPDEDVDYAKRYPAERSRFVADALARLDARGVIAGRDYDRAAWRRTEEALRRFDHGGRKTYIYPEEAELLFAIASVKRPRRSIFLGSYYGYWAAAALPPVAAAGGSLLLVDPDPGCCALAARNFADAIAGGTVAVACATGEAALAANDAPFDLVVIDAELPRDHPVTALRGKGVYAPLLEAVLPHLAPGALLVCHNILLSDWTEAPVFDAIVDRNRAELTAFEALARRHFPDWTEIASTEGIGVGSLAADRGEDRHEDRREDRR